MRIPIKYNEVADEFSNDLTLEERLEKYIKEHFYPAYIISTLCPIFLLGGGIRDLICASKPKDLDFVIMGSENMDWVMKVFDKFKPISLYHSPDITLHSPAITPEIVNLTQ